MMKFKQLLITGITGFALSSGYADDTATSPQVPAIGGAVMGAAAVEELKKLNDSTVPAVPMSINETINNLFATPDAFFPNINATSSDQLDTLDSVNQASNEQTQDYLKTQLQTLSNQLGTAYLNLSSSRSEQLPDPLKDSVKNLTYDTPSFDTFYLPEYSCSVSNDPTVCAYKPSDEVAQGNANSLNFDAFFGNNNYSSSNQEQAENYIQYVLQTYDPTFESTGSSSDNKSFFDALNDKLIELNGSTDSSSETASGFLITHVLQNSDFQKFWIALRSYQAKRSMILSNFNYLKAERTPQTGLGTAYGLSTADASPLEVENGLMDQTINNPDWYAAMKTASPATLQREQLILTSILLRVEARNKSINERNLATLSILTDSLLKQSKQALSQQETQLKTTILPSSTSN